MQLTLPCDQEKQGLLLEQVKPHFLEQTSGPINFALLY